MGIGRWSCRVMQKRSRACSRVLVKSIVIKLDEQTLTALNRVAGGKQRSAFVRQAIRRAIRDAEYRAIYQAYCKAPDSILDCDDWSAAEAYRAFHPD